ncbi:hypothetical protein DDD64_06395 [Actinotignum sanguinis]|nr:hypothetical protein DDD64_06395 [Actinotignum sanguinis]
MKRSYVDGITWRMLGLASVSAILYLLSLLVLCNESGTVVAAIMLSGAAGIGSSLYLYQILKRDLSSGVAGVLSFLNCAAMTGGALFLLLSLMGD